MYASQDKINSYTCPLNIYYQISYTFILLFFVTLQYIYITKAGIVEKYAQLEICLEY